VIGERKINTVLRLKNFRINNGAKAVGVLLLIPAGLLMAQGSGQSEKTISTTATPRVSISNLAGKVTVRGWDRLQVHVAYTNIDSIKGDTSIDSLGGTISVADAEGHLSIRSVGGNIEIIRSSGRVEAYSINGNLHFVSPASTRLRGTTTSGTIVYEGDFAPGGDYVLSDYSGDITVICPSSASFELDAKTVRGKLDNQFPLVPRGPSSQSFHPPGNSIFGTQGSGQATLEVTSFSGAIRVRQQ
jgi:DUF4097 and DUF4098 domain-containing protein YvlB